MPTATISSFVCFFLNHPCTTCVVAFSMFLKYPSNYSLFTINPQNPRFFGKKWMTSPKSFPLQASCQRHPEMLTPCNALITAEKNHGAWICGHAMGSIANLNQPWRYPLVNIQKTIENCHLVRGFTYWISWFSSSLCRRLPEGIQFFCSKNGGNLPSLREMSWHHDVHCRIWWCRQDRCFWVFLLSHLSPLSISSVSTMVCSPRQDAVECESPCNCLFWAVWFVVNFVIVVESTCLRCCLIGWLVGWLVGTLMRFAGESGSSFADELPSGDLPLSSAKVQSPLEGAAAKLEVPLNELGSFFFHSCIQISIILSPPKKGWWFGTFFIFSIIYGNFIIPTDELHHFSEG